MADVCHHEGLNLHIWANMLLKTYCDDSDMMGVNIYIGHLFWSSQPRTPFFFDLLLLIIFLLLLLWLLKSVFITVLICNVMRRLITLWLFLFPLGVTAPDTGRSQAGEAFQFLQGGGAEATCSSAPLWREKKYSSRIIKGINKKIPNTNILLNAHFYSCP